MPDRPSRLVVFAGGWASRALRRMAEMVGAPDLVAALEGLQMSFDVNVGLKPPTDDPLLHGLDTRIAAAFLAPALTVHGKFSVTTRLELTAFIKSLEAADEVFGKRDSR